MSQYLLGVDLSRQRSIQFGRTVTWDELGFFETEKVGKTRAAT
jgi:hypothetical protein